eukprot:COSAG05_NODE_10916_length_539_cov_0.945455_1_plen_35_part_10
MSASEQAGERGLEMFGRSDGDEEEGGSGAAEEEPS